MFGRLIVFESFAIVHEITRRIRVSANLTSERECREREKEREEEEEATFDVKETSGLSIFDERCRSLARSLAVLNFFPPLGLREFQEESYRLNDDINTFH